MSAEKQREADIAFLRNLAVETQVGSTMVALAMAADRLAKEPLVLAQPKAAPLSDLRPKTKAKTKSKPKHDRRSEPEAEEKSDLEEEADKSFEL
jgi:hypothetical protein